MALFPYISDLDSKGRFGPFCRARRIEGRSFSALLLLVFVLLLAPCWAAPGPTSDDCLACHSDKSLTTKRGGRTVSLFSWTRKSSPDPFTARCSAPPATPIWT